MRNDRTRPTLSWRAETARQDSPRRRSARVTVAVGIGEERSVGRAARGVALVRRKHPDPLERRTMGAAQHVTVRAAAEASIVAAGGTLPLGGLVHVLRRR